ncbi:PREDICTED: 17-beta-hydroxysteroid dehydrogenase 13-like [Diuraphis noxia]|uniref:17-beta-hydroxysteroid dehydrogenase 13-like n=1 Tax=Diuraphis noxia TaxID=143948 RepID=UPI0007636FA5|nr:PREDICTED: 17-beta-hydroxysteroid dehydrogenase 13-like [Diuraphis noxia]
MTSLRLEGEGGIPSLSLLDWVWACVGLVLGRPISSCFKCSNRTRHFRSFVVLVLQSTYPRALVDAILLYLFQIIQLIYYYIIPTCFQHVERTNKTDKMKWKSILTELLLLLVKSVYYIGESIYYMFVPLPEKSLADDIVLITGTGHGIGKCLAMQFADVSAKVVCVDINEKSNVETVKEINAKWKGKAFAYTMLDTFLPGMKALNKGHVVFLSSMAGIIGLKNLVPYCASKFAVRGLSEAIMDECRDDGFKNLRFTCIYPYMVDTGLCKKPIIRFPGLLPLVTPESTAREIISAVKKNLLEQSIPSPLLVINNIFRCYPHKMAMDFKDFMGGGVDAHDD